MHPSATIAPRLDRATIEGLTGVMTAAAERILRVGPGEARLKPDGSPVTAADEASEASILSALPRWLPGVPVVAEEQASRSGAQLSSRTFALVDPLDGTREFLAGRNEYTVNLALVVDGEPALGIIAAPALGLLWRGTAGRAERLQLRGTRAEDVVTVKTRRWPGCDPLALVSRSHLDPRSVALLARCSGVRQQPCGSSLKFCRLAEGAADLYPRLAPTSEWDIAAGQALLAAAGGIAVRPDGAPLTYGHAEEGFRVPGFLALGDPAALPRLLGRDG